MSLFGNQASDLTFIYGDEWWCLQEENLNICIDCYVSSHVVLMHLVDEVCLQVVNEEKTWRNNKSVTEQVLFSLFFLS